MGEWWQRGGNHADRPQALRRLRNVGAGVWGGTIGVARFIRPAQCPTRPFGHSLCYKRGAISAHSLTFVMNAVSQIPGHRILEECSVRVTPEFGAPKIWDTELGGKWLRLGGPLTSPRDLCWTLNTRSF